MTRCRKSHFARAVYASDFALMAAAERFVDTLPADRSYTAEAATAYDAYMPPGTVFPDDVVHQSVIRRNEGVGLELATGNGRFLIPALEAGLHVEGVDNSVDMLAICRRHVDERGLQTELHHGDMASLALGRQYHSIVCPAGSFSLLTDVLAAHEALRAAHDHLKPGGEVSITLFSEGPRDGTDFMWRLRRTGTDPRTGLTYVVHESVGPDLAPQTILTNNRMEIFDADGRQVGTEFRKIRVRWWHRDEFSAALADAGFQDVQFIGDAHGWVAIAKRP
jgi:SAM-dependent methyltransferase